MSNNVVEGGKKGKALLQVTMILISTLSVLMAFSPVATAAADVVSLTDVMQNPLTIVGNNSMIRVNANDGTTTGGTKTGTVVQQGVPANTITITMYDNGAVMGDTASDKNFVGFFNITNSATGGTTSQGAGRIAVPNAAIIQATVNLDGDANSGTASVTTDFQKPTASITSAANLIISGKYYLKVSASDTNMKEVTYQVDGGDTFPATNIGGNLYQAAVDTKNLTEDQHEIMVTVKDLAANENYAWVNFTLDRTPPEVKIKPAPKYVNQAYFLNVTITDIHLNESTIAYRLDAESLVPIPKTGTDQFSIDVDLTGKEELEHTIYIQARDVADNTNNTEFVKVIYDNTKAAIKINTPANSVVKDALDLNVTVSDENLNKAEVRYKLDGGMAIQIPEKGLGFFEVIVNTVPLLEGQHNVVVTVKDLANNVNTTSALNFIVDKTAPNITITSATVGYYNDLYTMTADIKETNVDKVYYYKSTGSGTGDLLGVLPNVGGTTYSKDIDVKNWTEMSYSLKIVAWDMAKNSKESGLMTVVVDRSPPSFSYSLKPMETGFRLEVIVSDANLDAQSVKFKLDTGVQKEFDQVVSNKYTAIINKADFGEGNHTITVYATDKAGNKGEKAFEEAIVIPPPPVTGLAATDLTDGKVRLTWTASTASDIDHYNMYYRAYDIFTDVVGLTPAMTTKELTYTITSLVVGTRYYFAITAVDTHGYENKTVTPLSVTSRESPKIPAINVTLITASKTKDLRAGDTIDYNVTIKNTGNLNATGIKIRLMVDNTEFTSETISSLSPGQTTQRTLSWNADEGTHNLTVDVVYGVAVLTQSKYGAVTVGPQKQTVINTGGLNLTIILIIVGVVAGVAVMAGLWHMANKQSEAIKKEEIELGLRPDKDGKVHKPEDQMKSGGPPKPGAPPQQRAPDVQIPSSPLLQQQPPAQPPAQPPQQ